MDIEVVSSAKELGTVRRSNQALMPDRIGISEGQSSDYNIFPFHSLGSGKIFSGFDTLADFLAGSKLVVLDGYAGIYWNVVREALEIEFSKAGKTVKWFEAADHLKAGSDIEEMVIPFLGTPGSVWGTKTDLRLKDFFVADTIESISPDKAADINIVIGTGASLCAWDATVVYFDLPKNELQYRMRSGSISNLGVAKAEDAVSMYKRFYFVDWVVLNQHKQDLAKRMAVVADTQWGTKVNWVKAPDLFEGLRKLSGSVFRARPWFEPGAWGGQFMKDRIPGLNKDEVNYAWSFELISPENGLVFESEGRLLEVSFDFLMNNEYEAVLGKHAERFKTEFPIRFDFLDTYDGGNLSIQCHPSLDYIQKEFGENITQDETYYMLEAKQDAVVYLGFQEDIDPAKFRQELDESNREEKEVDVEKYVKALPARKHDLFLIPNGTVHSAGEGALVLEISATPYIFTFKMYDWVRMDLEGNPRPINIDHAFRNLNFDRKGERVEEELVSKPYILDKGADWSLYHLPTHAEHFYDIHRMEFNTEISIETANVCHILMLVEGTTVGIETADGTQAVFQYAETFVVPAAAGSYKLLNRGPGVAKVVKAFVK